MRRLNCYADILKEGRGSLFRQNSVLVFFQSFSETRASPPALLDIGYNALDGAPTVEEEMPSSQIAIFLLDFIILCEIL